MGLLKKAVEYIQHLQQLVNCSISSSFHCIPNPLASTSPESSSYMTTPFMDSSFYPHSASSPFCPLTPNRNQTSPASRAFPSFSPTITKSQSETWIFEDLGCYPLKGENHMDLKIGHADEHPTSLPKDYELIEAIANWQRHWIVLKRITRRLSENLGCWKTLNNAKCHCATHRNSPYIYAFRKRYIEAAYASFCSSHDNFDILCFDLIRFLLFCSCLVDQIKTCCPPK